MSQPRDASEAVESLQAYHADADAHKKLMERDRIVAGIAKRRYHKSKEGYEARRDWEVKFEQQCTERAWKPSFALVKATRWQDSPSVRPMQNRL